MAPRKKRGRRAYKTKIQPQVEVANVNSKSQSDEKAKPAKQKLEAIENEKSFLPEKCVCLMDVSSEKSDENAVELKCGESQFSLPNTPKEAEAALVAKMKRFNICRETAKLQQEYEELLAHVERKQFEIYEKRAEEKRLTSLVNDLQRVIEVEKTCKENLIAVRRIYEQEDSICEEIDANFKIICELTARRDALKVKSSVIELE